MAISSFPYPIIATFKKVFTSLIQVLNVEHDRESFIGIARPAGTIRSTTELTS
jgi:hypothetical protein